MSVIVVMAVRKYLTYAVSSMTINMTMT